MPAIEPELCNATALRQAARHVTRLYDDALAPAGLGLNQYSILARLDRTGPTTIPDLAQLLVMERAVLRHLLRPLERRGLVALRVSVQDRRRRGIALTPAGSALLRIARPLWAGAQRRFESQVGEAAALELRAALNAVSTTEFGTTAAIRGAR